MREASQLQCFVMMMVMMAVVVVSGHLQALSVSPDTRQAFALNHLADLLQMAQLRTDAIFVFNALIFLRLRGPELVRWC